MQTAYDKGPAIKTGVNQGINNLIKTLFPTGYTMNKRYFLISILCLTLSGCATSDYDTSDDRQPPSGMSGGGMGRGSGGGGHQQGPPDMNRNNSDETQPLPEEAFTACLGKKEGDYIVLKLAEGRQLKATCQLIDDQMVAVPQEKKQTGRR